MKKVIVVTSSPRKGGNSETLAVSFAEGAKAAGDEVKIVPVRDVKLQFCIGCMFCQTHDRCVLGDGMNALYADFEHADVIVFATPVYYYAVCGQLKTFLDRLNPLYPRENAFKDVYLLAASAENADSAMDGCVKDIQGWIDCFDGARLAGVLRATGVEAAGDVNGTDFVRQAYDMGKNL